MTTETPRLILRADPAYPAGGHALLYLQGATRSPADAALILRRLTPPEGYLAPNGWQATESVLMADELGRDENGTPVLHLGPQVVNQVAPHLKVEVTLPSLGLKQLLVWPPLPQSPEEYLPTAGHVAGGAPARRKPVPASPPPQEEPPAPPPVEEPPAPVVPEREPIVQSEDEEESPPPRRRRRLWLWMLLLLLLIGGGLAAWQILTDEPRRLLCAWGLLDCQATVCPESAPPRERADCLIGDLGAQEAFALAEQLGGTGKAEERNLAWLLLDGLARRNHAPAYLELGLCFDPLLPEGCSLRPRLAANARQALDNYRRATGLGASDAGLHIDKLCEWLNQQTDLQSQATAQEFCR